MATTDVRSQETSTMIPTGDVATMTNAETIASLRAELAELGVRIGAPDDVADLRSAAHRAWRIASLLQREHKEFRAALLEMEHRATTAEATVAALMDDGAATLSALRDAAVAEAARHATAAERARCLAAATQRRDGASPIGPPVWSHEELTAAVAGEREACARVCEVEASWQAKQGRTTEFVLRAVAREIRARGSQEPPQRPEAPADVATAAPVAPSPAGGLPVAAAGVGDDTPGRAYERGRLAGLDEAAGILRAEADARAGQRGSLSQHDVVACDRTVGALRRVAYAVERAKALVSATKEGGR